MRGLTLLECLIGLLIVSFLLIMAVPMLQHTRDRLRIDAATQQLLQAIHSTRAQAILQQNNVYLRPTQKDWSDGYEICSDTQCAQRYSSNKAVTISWQSFPLRDELAFNAEGLSAYQNGTFLLQDRSGLERKIIINQMGRARIG